ncbi:hypothetical protein NU219Hw_g4199t3 [Hortaea werneckii]
MSSPEATSQLYMNPLSSKTTSTISS